MSARSLTVLINAYEQIRTIAQFVFGDDGHALLGLPTIFALRRKGRAQRVVEGEADGGMAEPGLVEVANDEAESAEIADESETEAA